MNYIMTQLHEGALQTAALDEEVATLARLDPARVAGVLRETSPLVRRYPWNDGDDFYGVIRFGERGPDQEDIGEEAFNPVSFAAATMALLHQVEAGREGAGRSFSQEQKAIGLFGHSTVMADMLEHLRRGEPGNATKLALALNFLEGREYGHRQPYLREATTGWTRKGLARLIGTASMQDVELSSALGEDIPAHSGGVAETIRNRKNQLAYTNNGEIEEECRESVRQYVIKRMTAEGMPEGDIATLVRPPRPKPGELVDPQKDWESMHWLFVFGYYLVTKESGLTSSLLKSSAEVATTDFFMGAVKEARMNNFDTAGFNILNIIPASEKERFEKENKRKMEPEDVLARVGFRPFLEQYVFLKDRVMTRHRFRLMEGGWDAARDIEVIDLTGQTGDNSGAPEADLPDVEQEGPLPPGVTPEVAHLLKLIKDCAEGKQTDALGELDRAARQAEQQRQFEEQGGRVRRALQHFYFERPFRLSNFTDALRRSHGDYIAHLTFPSGSYEGEVRTLLDTSRQNPGLLQSQQLPVSWRYRQKPSADESALVMQWGQAIAANKLGLAKLPSFGADGETTTYAKRAVEALVHDFGEVAAATRPLTWREVRHNIMAPFTRQGRHTAASEYVVNSGLDRDDIDLRAHGYQPRPLTEVPAWMRLLALDVARNSRDPNRRQRVETAQVREAARWYGCDPNSPVARFLPILRTAEAHGFFFKGTDPGLKFRLTDFLDRDVRRRRRGLNPDDFPPAAREQYEQLMAWYRGEPQLRQSRSQIPMRPLPQSE